MTRTATVVQVFVASPSDVQEERDILEVLISELNGSWSKALGVRFELIRWETHTSRLWHGSSGGYQRTDWRHV
jgi:hypothetical protein